MDINGYAVEIDLDEQTVLFDQNTVVFLQQWYSLVRNGSITWCETINLKSITEN